MSLNRTMRLAMHPGFLLVSQRLNRISGGRSAGLPSYSQKRNHKS